jgi:3-deoxy-7-phosphoheptulonate synthase
MIILLLFFLLRLVASMPRGDLRHYQAVALAQGLQENVSHLGLMREEPQRTETVTAKEATLNCNPPSHRARRRRAGVTARATAERASILGLWRLDDPRLCLRPSRVPDRQVEIHPSGDGEPDCSSMPAPDEVKRGAPLTARAEKTVTEGRAALRAILDRRDPRLFVVLGPCSIHDPVAAREYAARLKGLAAEVADTLLLVMRVYFEKPRTSVGWKGFINDPYLDGSFRMAEGMTQARRLLLDLAEMGLPTASEALDPMSPQYLGDLVSWYAIGARTTESQTHREMASGLAAPVGFKNGTDGDLEVACNAIKSAAQPHRFLGINRFGRSAILQTRGNTYGHLVLRGGGCRPNYDAASVRLAENELAKAVLGPNIVADCSHENSLKDPSRQPLVFDDCVKQIIEGNRSIVGLMLESHLNAGKQTIPDDLSTLRYGVSVTDGCIDWATTEDVVRRAHAALAPVLAGRRER